MSYKLDCPICGAEPEDARLEVISGTFQTRKMFVVPDGFSFSDAKGVCTSDEQVRCDNCGKLLGKEKGAQIHILRKPIEFFASFPVTATCPGCGRLNTKERG